MKTKDDVFNYILEKVLPDMDSVDYDPGDVIMRVRDMCYEGLQIKEQVPEMTEQNKELERLRNEGEKRFGSKKYSR